MNIKTGIAAVVAALMIIPAAVCLAGDAPDVPAFAPESDLSRSLGKPGRRWHGVYADYIANDILRIDINSIAKVVAGGSEDYVTHETLDNSLAEKANASHLHMVENIIGLKNALDSKADTNDLSAYITKSALDSKLSEKADSLHGHTISDVDELQDELDIKAPLESPAFTGNVTVPTPVVTDSSSRPATTGWVKAQGYITDNDVNVDLTGYVPTSRGLSVAAPLTGGGDFTANRTNWYSGCDNGGKGCGTANHWRRGCR